MCQLSTLRGHLKRFGTMVWIHTIRALQIARPGPSLPPVLVAGRQVSIENVTVNECGVEINNSTSCTGCTGVPATAR